ncbi:hypothetical protein [Plantactinospora sp. GCM10030261]|uniref:hypothetical protein n=1 Tax=Plantactinospora sp. GCM10030261 TaxID=3273420 RepID=UPI00360B4204
MAAVDAARVEPTGSTGAATPFGATGMSQAPILGVPHPAEPARHSGAAPPPPAPVQRAAGAGTPARRLGLGAPILPDEPAAAGSSIAESVEGPSPAGTAPTAGPLPFPTLPAAGSPTSTAPAAGDTSTADGGDGSGDPPATVDAGLIGDTAFETALGGDVGSASAAGAEPAADGAGQLPVQRTASDPRTPTGGAGDGLDGVPLVRPDGVPPSRGGDSLARRPPAGDVVLAPLPVHAPVAVNRLIGDQPPPLSVARLSEHPAARLTGGRVDQHNVGDGGPSRLGGSPDIAGIVPIMAAGATRAATAAGPPAVAWPATAQRAATSESQHWSEAPLTVARATPATAGARPVSAPVVAVGVPTPGLPPTVVAAPAVQRQVVATPLGTAADPPPAAAAAAGTVPTAGTTPMAGTIPTAGTTPMAGTTPGAGAGGEPEELLAKLFDPLLRRLKAELRIDRDRRGSLTDLRR